MPLDDFTRATGLLAAAIDYDHPERANDRAKRAVAAITANLEREIRELRAMLAKRLFCGHCGRKL